MAGGDGLRSLPHLCHGPYRPHAGTHQFFRQVVRSPRSARGDRTSAMRVSMERSIPMPDQQAGA